MELDIIKLQTTWNDAASNINTNFTKIRQAISSLESAGGGGLDEDELLTFLTENKYVTSDNLSPYAKITDVANVYATKQMLATTNLNVTNIGNRVGVLESYFTTSEDADTQINKWNEIVAFLDATEGTTLAGILAAYTLKTDFETEVERIDSAIGTKAEQTALSALETQVSAFKSLVANTYATKTYVDEEFAKIDLGAYAKSEDVASTYATKQMLQTTNLRVTELEAAAITINETEVKLGGSFKTAEITGGGVGTSLPTSGYTLSVPHFVVNNYGIVTSKGTHLHTINNIPNSSLENSVINIAGTSVSLGGSITVATLQSALGVRFPAWTEITGTIQTIDELDEFNFITRGTLIDILWLNNHNIDGKGSGKIGQYAFGSGGSKGLATLLASGYVVRGGTSSQFLKADGSVDSTAYLSTAGGTITGAFGALTIKRHSEHASGIKYENTNGVLGYLGFNGSEPYFWGENLSNAKALIHAGNYSNYALPLSGGTISGASGALTIARTDADQIGILFKGKSGNLGYLGFGSSGTPAYINNAGTPYTLLHSDNVGEYALKTNGSNVMGGPIKWNPNNNLIAGFSQQGSGLSLYKIIDTEISPDGTPYWSTLSAITTFAGFQISVHGGSIMNPYYRKMRNSGDWSNWKAIAFTDSDITGNAASATKLQTPRTIWGQSFDGTGDVEGDLSIKWSKIYWNADSNNYYIGYNSSEYAFDYVNYYGHRFHSKGSERMRITSDGNVLIGTTDDNGSGAKLQVNGGVSIASGYTLKIGDATISYVNGVLKVDKPFMAKGYAAGATASVSSGEGGVILNKDSIIKALGYTPYDAANPSNYTTRSAIFTGSASQFLKADGSVDSTAYLSTVGGTISGNLVITGALEANKGITVSSSRLLIKTYIRFNQYNEDKEYLLGMTTAGSSLQWYDGSKWNRILNAGNYSDYALSLSGGQMTGDSEISWGGGVSGIWGTNNGLFLRAPLLQRRASDGSYYTVLDSGNGIIRKYIEQDVTPTVNTFGLWNNVGAYFSVGYSDAYKMEFRGKVGGAFMRVCQGTGSDTGWKTILTAGNVGEYALKIDGSNKMSNGVLFSDRVLTEGRSTRGTGIEMFKFAEGGSASPTGSVYFSILHAVSSYAGLQLAVFGGGDDNSLYYRKIGESNTWSDWMTIAFTDSDITGYAAGLKHSNGTVGAIVNSSGNVTIGGSDLAGTSAKLYVDGNVAIGENSIIDGASRRILMSNGGNLFLGTTDAVSLTTYVTGNSIKFRTGANSYVRMVITDSGNVGIGTTSPEHKLHVAGDVALTGGLKFMDGYSIQSYNNSPLSINALGNNILLGPNGNIKVGVCTDNPQYNLDVNGTIGVYESLNFTRQSWNYITVPATNGILAFNVGAAGTANTKMCITNNGNVLIGTTTDSGDRLQVSGNLHIGGGALRIGNGTLTQALIQNTGSVYEILAPWKSDSSAKLPINIGWRGGTVAMTIANNGAVTMASTLTVGGDVTPSAGGTYNLGGNSARWKDLYCGAIWTSEIDTDSLYVNDHIYSEGNIYSEVSLTTDGYIKVGDATISYESGVLKIDKPIMAKGYAAGATATATEGGGGNTYDLADINNSLLARINNGVNVAVCSAATSLNFKAKPKNSALPCVVHIVKSSSAIITIPPMETSKCRMVATSGAAATSPVLVPGYMGVTLVWNPTSEHWEGFLNN